MLTSELLLSGQRTAGSSVTLSVLSARMRVMISIEKSVFVDFSPSYVTIIDLTGLTFIW